MKYYKKFNGKERVDEEFAEEYALDNLGITIEPVGANGEYTLEQLDFKKEFTDWYFSGEWVLLDEEEEEYGI